MKITFSFFCAAVLIFFSCSKDGNNTTPPQQTDSYINTSTGSLWNYHTVDNSGSTAPVDYTVTSTSRDSSINGKNYHVYNNTTGSNQYLAISGHNYYQYDSLPAGLGLDAIERLYLKDDGSAGTSWDQSLSVNVPGFPFPIPFTISNTIIGIEISRMVNGTNYSNVIHVSTSISSSLLPAGSLVTDINSYYALKYGLIENSTIIHLDFAGMTEDLDTETKLVSATLQ
ncbi:MAG: hypothetical protein ABIO81_08760 [Ginsengibacter sp.]